MKNSPTVKWITTRPGAELRAAAPAAAGRAAANLVVSDRTDQIWRGFGGCFNEMGWDVLSRIPAAGRETVMRDLFAPGRGLAFNYCRLPVGANDYALSWYSLDEAPGDLALRKFSIERDRRCLIPYIRSALRYQPGMTLFASPWSPPTWLKNPPVYNYGTMVWRKEYLRAYANYFLKFVRAYATEGVRIAQIHVQNEPMADQKFPSCLWSGAQLRDFIRDYLGPLFEREKAGTEVWLGTLNGGGLDPDNGYDRYAGLALNDTRARRYISGVSYQWAGRTAVQKTHAAWPALPVIQSENECGDGTNTWHYAYYIFDLVQHYIANGVAAYVYWNMVLPPGGASTWGWKQNAIITVDPETGRATRNPEYYVMRHFAGFIRPGARRVALEGEWSANGVCFRQGRETVLVIKNGLPHAATVVAESGSARVRLRLPAGSINTVVISE